MSIYALKELDMMINQRAVSDNAIIELLETKAFFSLPKIYRDIIRSADINDKERYFIYELFFDFLEHWRKGSNNNRLTVTVQKLSKKYNRSLETIRRYLRALEEAGLIRKVLTTIKQAGKILTPIVGIDFILPDSLTQEALSQDNRAIVDNSAKNLPANNKNDHSPQLKSTLQDNKTVEQLLDQDQIEELLALIIFKTNENSYQHTIDKSSLFYIIKRFKELPFHMGFQTIKQTISQMLFDLNKDGWHTDDPRFRLNIMLKKIANNTYKIYIKTKLPKGESNEFNDVSEKYQPDTSTQNNYVMNIDVEMQTFKDKGILHFYKSKKYYSTLYKWVEQGVTAYNVILKVNELLLTTGSVSMNNLEQALLMNTIQLYDNNIMSYLKMQVESGIEIKDLDSSSQTIVSWQNRNTTALQVESALHSILEETGTVSINAINDFFSNMTSR